MKILVTGTAGFIGYHVTKRLLDRGDDVVAVDIVNSYYDPNLKWARLAELGVQATDVADDDPVKSSHYSEFGISQDRFGRHECSPLSIRIRAFRRGLQFGCPSRSPAQP
jgi:NAD(P)-dependent dehydrogenase (short-subunit alcohol dehydrogenase family)